MIKTIRLFFLLAVFGVVAYLSFSLYTLSKTQMPLKEDYVFLSDIQYGLFNIDEWEKVMTQIIITKIDEFHISPTKRKEIKKKITTFLEQLTNDFESKYNAEKSKSFKGKVEKKIASITGVFKKIKDEIPFFTDQILDFVSDHRNKKMVKKILVDKLNEYLDKTFAEIDYTQLNQIVKKYHCTDKSQALSYLTKEIKHREQEITQWKYYLIGVAGLMFLFLCFFSPFSVWEYLISIATCVVFLTVGVSLPMIELDARITEFSMELLNTKVSFVDQILYYKSKSIIQVIHLMLTAGTIDLKIVGVLVCLFSLIFPFTKMILSLFVIYKPNVCRYKVIDFLVFKTGKWSMADVMVIAIFMSYIGFSGILTEQLGQIQGLYQSLTILTTNQSQLQVGFFAFTAFSVLGLLTTYKLQQQIAKSKTNKIQ